MRTFAVLCVTFLVAFVVAQGPNPNPNPNPWPQPPPNNPAPGPLRAEDRYDCDPSTKTCELSADAGGVPLTDCQMTCGKFSNSTPPELIGTFRGIRVDNKYEVGEWHAVIDKHNAIITDPTGQVWARGSLVAWNENLGLRVANGFMSGLRAWLETEQVGIFTWALGDVNKPGPIDFDSAMSGKNNTVVLTFARCLSSSSHCNFASVQSVLKRKVFETLAKKPIPGVPQALKGKIYRGLQISQNGCEGEIRFSFGTTTLNVTSFSLMCPANYSFKVSTVGDFRMWWTPLKSSKSEKSDVFRALWALDGGPATEFLNLAAGYQGSPGPANFSSGMTSIEFILAGCQEPYPNSPRTCIFK